VNGWGGVVRELQGDLWELHVQGAVVAVTTGGQVNPDGCCAMPRGCANQARERFPGLAWTLGQQILSHGNHVSDLGRRVVSFPVENSPLEVPGLKLIEQSSRELVELTDYKGWTRVVVPRPGCGGGGLEWPTVSQLLERFFDDRFLVISVAETANQE
jgi:hypothetical protein